MRISLIIGLILLMPFPGFTQWVVYKSGFYSKQLGELPSKSANFV